MWIYLSVHIKACDAPKRQPWKASRSTLARGGLAGAEEANMKTFWSRVTFADCCQHLFPSLFSSQTIPDVVSQPVGGQCEQEIGEKGSFFSKEFARGWGKSRWGRSWWGKDWGGKAATPKCSNEILCRLFCCLTFPLPQKGRLDWKMHLLVLTPHLTTEKMLEKKRDGVHRELHSWPVAVNGHHKQVNSCSSILCFCTGNLFL